jgi:hypothetical protein
VDEDEPQCDLCGRYCCWRCYDEHFKIGAAEDVNVCCDCVDSYFLYGIKFAGYWDWHHDEEFPSSDAVSFVRPVQTFASLLIGAFDPDVCVRDLDGCRPFVCVSNLYRLRAEVEMNALKEQEDLTIGIDREEAHSRLRRLFEEAHAEAYPGVELPVIAPLVEYSEDPVFFPGLSV